MRNNSFSLMVKSAFFAAVLLSPLMSNAAVVISGTRIVYPEKANDITVRLDNKGATPLLVQTWLDDGRETVNPQEMKVPFVVTPPVFRMNPQRGQTVRISSVGNTLPQDKETVFWFNVLEVPPKDKNSDSQNQMQLAFRSRIKMFYRPTAVKGDPAIAAQNLKWTLEQSGSVIKAKATNDSPFYISLGGGHVSANGQEYQITTGMIAPQSSLSMDVKGLKSQVSGAKISYSAINDYGGSIKKDVQL
ncbi:fimbrial chaperone [Dryocola sp. BD626]|uniref:fimbrial chaperone n=1 Tax=Dryocola sp. BD626 TaxID=3133273 RepID=UPI003F50ADCF